MNQRCFNKQLSYVNFNSIGMNKVLIKKSKIKQKQIKDISMPSETLNDNKQNNILISYPNNFYIYKDYEQKRNIKKVGIKSKSNSKLKNNNSSLNINAKIYNVYKKKKIVKNISVLNNNTKKSNTSVNTFNKSPKKNQIKDNNNLKETKLKKELQIEDCLKYTSKQNIKSKEFVNIEFIYLSSDPNRLQKRIKTSLERNYRCVENQKKNKRLLTTNSEYEILSLPKCKYDSPSMKKPKQHHKITKSNTFNTFYSRSNNKRNSMFNNKNKSDILKEKIMCFNENIKYFTNKIKYGNLIKNNFNNGKKILKIIKKLQKKRKINNIKNYTNNSSANKSNPKNNKIKLFSSFMNKNTKNKMHRKLLNERKKSKSSSIKKGNRPLSNESKNVDNNSKSSSKYKNLKIKNVPNNNLNNIINININSVINNKYNTNNIRLYSTNYKFNTNNNLPFNLMNSFHKKNDKKKAIVNEIKLKNINHNIKYREQKEDISDYYKGKNLLSTSCIQNTKTFSPKNKIKVHIKQQVTVSANNLQKQNIKNSNFFYKIIKNEGISSQKFLKYFYHYLYKNEVDELKQLTKSDTLIYYLGEILNRINNDEKSFNKIFETNPNFRIKQKKFNKKLIIDSHCYSCINYKSSILNILTINNKKNNKSKRENKYNIKEGEFKYRIGDHIYYRYEILKSLGKGSYGEAIKCYDHKTKKYVCIKVINSHKFFQNQAKMEITILAKISLNDINNISNCVKFFSNFVFRNHICLVFELLGNSLYQSLKINNFVGFNLLTIKSFATQILYSLLFMKSLKIIHCDLKPENILLVSQTLNKLKIIDFGSSCLINERIYSYIQSRFYRAPEVLFDLGYGYEIDMWSFGCIISELYTGVPIFPGTNEIEQIYLIINMIGKPPKFYIKYSPKTKLLFGSDNISYIYNELFSYDLNEGNKKINIIDFLNSTKNKKSYSILLLDFFVDLIMKCLVWDPNKRIIPEDALMHPFIINDMNSNQLYLHEKIIYNFKNCKYNFTLKERANSIFCNDNKKCLSNKKRSLTHRYFDKPVPNLSFLKKIKNIKNSKSNKNTFNKNISFNQSIQNSVKQKNRINNLNIENTESYKLRDKNSKNLSRKCSEGKKYINRSNSCKKNS